MGTLRDREREGTRPARLTTITVCDFQAKLMIYEQVICLVGLFDLFYFVPL